MNFVRVISWDEFVKLVPSCYSFLLVLKRQQRETGHTQRRLGRFLFLPSLRHWKNFLTAEKFDLTLILHWTVQYFGCVHTTFEWLGVYMFIPWRWFHMNRELNHKNFHFRPFPSERRRKAPRTTKSFQLITASIQTGEWLGLCYVGWRGFTYNLYFAL